ncbi:aminotransferase class V-fold PLP-dependent enzyme [Vibrio sp. JC009]|uniref:aminotransferase class V-fold PLP-dependent enzyme n=1 Tax=Vibrio sp. JC009 TaxID=2912314 RepID=UPI0023B0B9A3|nr:aminotransferase class V-fold PLP-dependent enzyme [Vibrio sp. JC009]WED23775.1 aminotransferase class V-fold PLP-dependent enzyme [Vibrio sp. JC009]
MIYLDHAATSNPKPASVAEAMVHFISEGCANPGRGSHPLANDAARLIFETRENLLDFFHAGENAQAVFTGNITQSLNLVLKGVVKPGDQVITSSMEHNAMMRPLRELEQIGVVVTVIPCDVKSGLINPGDIAEAITAKTRMIAMNHGSNTFGTVQPIEEIGRLCQKQGILFLLDTAQSAGVIPIDMDASHIDYLAFTGHKGLLGPMGTGGLILSEKAQREKIKPLFTGGTGSNSELEVQPDFLPDALESGTPNLPGIAGLNAGIHWLKEKGIENISRHEQELTAFLVSSLRAIPKVSVYGHAEEAQHVGVISFSIDGKDIGEIDAQLAYEHQICCRTGLHCSPASHKTMGTFPQGTIRLSIGAFTSREEITRVIEVITSLAEN